MGNHSGPVQILVVEDNPGDAMLFETFFRQTPRRSEFHFVSDGEQAWEFLVACTRSSDAICPDLIIVDINIPRIDGKELVKAIKSEDSLRHIPVIMLTSSENQADIVESYVLGANCVLSKASDVDKAMRLFGAMEEFWVQCARLPSPRLQAREGCAPM